MKTKWDIVVLAVVMGAGLITCAVLGVLADLPEVYLPALGGLSAALASLIRQIPGVVKILAAAAIPIGIGGGFMLMGCAGAQKPTVDIPCVSTCAVQAAVCTMSCIRPPQTQEEVSPP